MPTLSEVKNAPERLLLIRDLPLVDKEEIDGLRLWKEHQYDVPHEDLVFYGKEVRAIVSIGRYPVAKIEHGHSVDIEYFLIVTIPTWGHAETSRRIRMYDQMDPREFLEKEIRTWEPIDLSPGEVVAFYGEQIPTTDDLVLELVEDEYRGGEE